MKKKICVVTSGHLASSPRMLKAADAFHEAGYEVRMVCAEHVDWCIEAGNIERAKRPWKCQVIDWHPVTGHKLYKWSRFRNYIAKKIVYLMGAAKIPFSIINTAQSRVGKELLAAVLSEPCDFIYGGTSGGLIIAYLASSILRKPFACDFEDFHPGEASSMILNNQNKKIFERVIRFDRANPSFITCGSSSIAKKYYQSYQLKCEVLNNTFSVLGDKIESVLVKNMPLKLVWFSQRVGPNRGIEDVIVALQHVNPKPSLFLVGHCISWYKNELINLGKNLGVSENLNFVEPMDQQNLFKYIEKMDCGLAIEPGFDLNNKIALSNKVFSYMVSGLALIITKTEGQSDIIRYMGDNVVAYDPGKTDILAKGIQQWTEDGGKLYKAKSASLEAAKQRWNWDHPEEKGKLLSLVRTVLGSGS